MQLFSQKSLWLLFIGSSPAFAVFESFSFAGNGGNNTAKRLCGSMPFACDPPNMCSQDTQTRKWYCCAPGVADSVCWNGASKCDGEGTNMPSESQSGCTYGTTKYCCLKDIHVQKCQPNSTSAGAPKTTHYGL
ncbi:hypothetical protein GQ44DRAFT_22600 [Phaeosphaeriaceae sp. PMI808]|nr:hypothetical protein GQ44DRAFT_22600 [Phaeosphaeriaceae sp. PMI808]